MNKNLLKGLGIGGAITAMLAYAYIQSKLKDMENTYNEQLSVMSEPGSELAKKNQDFLELGEDCELISSFKKSLNFIANNRIFDTERLFTPEFSTDIEPILAETNHFYNETGGLRKSFLYDINLTIATIVDEKVPERELKNEYTSGMLQKGAKGKDVLALQELLNKLNHNPDKNIELTGDYNKATYNLVVETFHGTTAMLDIDSGAISKEFIKNFNQILTNLNY